VRVNDTPIDPYADGVTNPICETPVDVGIASAFPPKQDEGASTIGSADPSAAAGRTDRRRSDHTRQSFRLLSFGRAVEANGGSEMVTWHGCRRSPFALNPES
jgi:hypothetical protein